MPKFRNVMTGLAISTALVGGSLALATTTTTAAAATTTVVSATNGCGGWGHGCHGRNCNKLRNRNTNLNYWRPVRVDKRHIHKSNRAATIFAGPNSVVDIDSDDD